MCAIFGVLDYKGELSAVQRLRFVKAIGTAAEIRGTDATGIAFFQRDKLCIQKAAKPAHKMTYRIPAEAQYIMGHTRMATQGDASKNQNNHPFPGKVSGKGFALAHNGVLHNDYKLQRENHFPKTDIETDSYVAVQLIERQGELSPDSLKQIAEVLEGSFTFTILDQDNNLYFVRGDNPLMIYHYPEQGVYLYASTNEILKNALKKFSLNDAKHETIEPQEGEILQIDRHGKQSRFEFTVNNFFEEIVPWGYFYERQYGYSYDAAWQEYIRELKSAAQYYGYRPNEIDQLLADGYSALEIEALIYGSEN